MPVLCGSAVETGCRCWVLGAGAGRRELACRCSVLVPASDSEGITTAASDSEGFCLAIWVYVGVIFKNLDERCGFLACLQMGGWVGVMSRKLAKLAGVTLAIARFLSTGCKS